MKTKTSAIFSKVQWDKNKINNQKGQSLVETLIALQSLGSIFVFMSYTVILSWNSLCLHWVTHEATVCESLRDPDISCKQMSTTRLQSLAILDQLITYKPQKALTQWSVEMSIEVGFAKTKINRMETRHVLRQKM